MITTLLKDMLEILYNIVTIFAIFTIMYNNIVIIYGHITVKGGYVVNNIAATLFTILSKCTILLSVLLHCVDHHILQAI